MTHTAFATQFGIRDYNKRPCSDTTAGPSDNFRRMLLNAVFYQCFINVNYFRLNNSSDSHCSSSFSVYKILTSPSLDINATHSTWNELYELMSQYQRNCKYRKIGSRLFAETCQQIKLSRKCRNSHPSVHGNKSNKLPVPIIFIRSNPTIVSRVRTAETMFGFHRLNLYESINLVGNLVAYLGRSATKLNLWLIIQTL